MHNSINNFLARATIPIRLTRLLPFAKRRLYQQLKALIALRKRYPSLRRGNFQRLLADDTNGHYVFARTLGEEKIVVAMNAAPHQQKVEIPITPLKWANGRVVYNLMDNTRHTISGRKLTLSLPPWSGAWIG